jgi:Ceramidase
VGSRLKRGSAYLPSWPELMKDRACRIAYVILLVSLVVPLAGYTALMLAGWPSRPDACRGVAAALVGCGARPAHACFEPLDDASAARVADSARRAPACFPAEPSDPARAPDARWVEEAGILRPYRPTGRCFCEVVSGANVAQPWNTFSNAPTLGLGLVLLWLAARSRPRADAAALMQREPTYRAIYAGVLVFMAIGSAFYHSSLNLLNASLDVGSMTTFVSYLFWYNVASFRGWPLRRFVAAFLATTLVHAIALPLLQVWDLAIVLFAIEMVFVFGLEIFGVFVGEWHGARRSAAVFWLWVASFSVGAFLQTRSNGPDEAGPLCCPLHPQWGHPLWHVLSGVGAALLGVYLSSEDRRRRPRSRRRVWATSLGVLAYIAALLTVSLGRWP